MNRMDSFLRNDWRKFFIFAALVTVQLLAQPLKAQTNATLPQERVADSFQLYSQLIPQDDARDRRMPHELWFVQDLTITVLEQDKPCVEQPDKKRLRDTPVYGLNPHTAVIVPDRFKKDLKEILADYDAHCHDRWQLPNNAKWNLRSPVQLLSESEQQAFHASRGDGQPSAKSADPKFKKGYAVFAFSPVFFNHDHTVALVYETHWCGDTCEEGHWAAFTREGKDWIPLQVTAVMWGQ